MFKLEKLQGGPIITVQSLYAYVCGALMTGMCSTVSLIFVKVLTTGFWMMQQVFCWVPESSFSEHTLWTVVTKTLESGICLP
jgi:hypothetical protein